MVGVGVGGLGQPGWVGAPHSTAAESIQSGWRQMEGTGARESTPVPRPNQPMADNHPEEAAMRICLEEVAMLLDVLQYSLMSSSGWIGYELTTKSASMTLSLLLPPSSGSSVLSKAEMVASE